MDNNTYRKLFGRYSKSKLLKFWKFHKSNPEVYKQFCRLAESWKSAGKTKCSASLIGNVIRWQVNIETESDDGFKLSNDWLPLYSRLLTWERPEDFDGFFEFKGE